MLDGITHIILSARRLTKIDHVVSESVNVIDHIQALGLADPMLCQWSVESSAPNMMTEVLTSTLSDYGESDAANTVRNVSSTH
jgi:hypothetical protein